MDGTRADQSLRPIFACGWPSAWHTRPPRGMPLLVDAPPMQLDDRAVGMRVVSRWGFHYQAQGWNRMSGAKPWQCLWRSWLVGREC
jgi:hypothetical protein